MTISKIIIILQNNYIRLSFICARVLLSDDDVVTNHTLMLVWGISKHNYFCHPSTNRTVYNSLTTTAPVPVQVPTASIQAQHPQTLSLSQVPSTSTIPPSTESDVAKLNSFPLLYSRHSRVSYCGNYQLILSFSWYM